MVIGRLLSRCWKCGRVLFTVPDKDAIVVSGASRTFRIAGLPPCIQRDDIREDICDGCATAGVLEWTA